MGTALYIIGRNDFQSRIDPNYTDSFLRQNNLNLIDEPQIHSMVLFVDTRESCNREIEYYKELNREKKGKN